MFDAFGFPLHALEKNPKGSPAVLFLHGWLDHCHSFDWVIDELPSSLRLIALDFRGKQRVVDSHWSTTRLELKRRAVMDALYILWRALEDAEEQQMATAGVGGAGRA